MSSSEKLLVPSEVTERLRIHRTTLDRLVREGKLPRPARVGNGLRWSESEIDKALEQSRGQQ
jgi:excisionase family DNA binding protein